MSLIALGRPLTILMPE